jgi:rSAM/selenodomain-associated transferase 1
MKRSLLIMAKRPLAGRTKTRLCPPLTLEQAAGLYECFLLDTIAMAKEVPGVQHCIAVTPPLDAGYFSRLAPSFEQLLQHGSTLSERLDDVMTQRSQAGSEQVVAISSDSPTLPAGYLVQAFDQLGGESVDVVLGPCEDGGYYLIGWKEPNPRLVRQVKMSTAQVLQDTLQIAAEESLRVALLPTWYDIDDASHLGRLESDLVAFPRAAHHTRQFLSELSDEKGVLVDSTEDGRHHYGFGRG